MCSLYEWLISDKVLTILKNKRLKYFEHSGIYTNIKKCHIWKKLSQYLYKMANDSKNNKITENFPHGTFNLEGHKS